MGEYIRDFKDLIVWQRGMELVVEVYRVTSFLPKGEGFGLVSQMQRSAVSIPSNIAEGKRRGSVKEYVHFLRVADGSAAELETQLLIAERIYGKVDVSVAMALVGEVQRMLAKMMEKLVVKKNALRKGGESR
jgi:four helix bundle protein